MPKKPTSARVSTLHFAGWDFDVTHDEVDLDRLRLDADNPRIRLHLDDGKKGAPTQDDLMKAIQDQPGYDELHKQIRDQGGIHDELIVRDDGRIVEGNTRFTIATRLSKTAGGKAKWGKVPIKRLAKDVDEVAIGLLMCNYHVSGKTPWRPAAQAAEIYHLLEANAPVERVMAATRMSKTKLQNHVAAYKMLLKEIAPLAPAARRREVIDSKFNHALELVSRSDLEEVRADPVARKQVAQAIANGGINGIEVRKLAPIMKNARARETLVRDGFKAAESVDKKANPVARSSVLSAVQKLDDKLKKLHGAELEVFTKHAKARNALAALGTTIENLLALATPKTERKRA